MATKWSFRLASFSFLKKCVTHSAVGHIIVDICLIFRIMPTVPPYTAETIVGRQITSRFLAYVRCYDVIQQQNPTNATQRGMYPEPNSGLFLLKRAKRANGEVVSDIIPLNQLRSLVDIAPRFGEKAILDSQTPVV